MIKIICKRQHFASDQTFHKVSVFISDLSQRRIDEK